MNKLAKTLFSAVALVMPLALVTSVAYSQTAVVDPSKVAMPTGSTSGSGTMSDPYLTTATTPTVSGMACANAVVTLTVTPSAGGTTITYSATADSTGAYTISLTNLSSGVLYKVTASYSCTDGSSYSGDAYLKIVSSLPVSGSVSFQQVLMIGAVALVATSASRKLLVKKN